MQNINTRRTIVFQSGIYCHVLSINWRKNGENWRQMFDIFISIRDLHRVSEKKTSTHIIGYKLGNSCL